MKRALLLSCAFVLVSCTTVTERPAGPAIAITIDDLPVHGPIPAGTSAVEVNAQIIAALRRSAVPGVHGFVNGASVEKEPRTAAALESWKAAGLPLANHGWAHRNLNELSVAEFEQELANNEPLLQSLGTDWRWFRFPFLAEGEDPAKRLAAREVLARRGYRIAAVTMDFSDWKWTAPFARCVESGDQGAVRELERMYLDAADGHLRARTVIGRRLYRRDIPQVLLLHVGAFTARMMPRLIELYRNAGVRFVALAEAQADPAYAEDIDPRMPPRSPFLDARAVQAGISAPPETDYTARLEAICR